MLKLEKRISKLHQFEWNMVSWFFSQVIIEGFKSYKEQVATEPFSPKHNCVGELLFSLCEKWVFFSSHLLCDGGRSLTTGWLFADIVSRQWIYIYIFCFGGFEELTSFLFLQLVPTDQGRQTSFMVCWFEYSGCHEVIVLIVRAFVAPAYGDSWAVESCSCNTVFLALFCSCMHLLGKPVDTERIALSLSSFNLYGSTRVVGHCLLWFIDLYPDRFFFPCIDYSCWFFMQQFGLFSVISSIICVLRIGRHCFMWVHWLILSCFVVSV